MTYNKKDNSTIINEATNHPLNTFFYPETVAIVGATRNPMRMNSPLTENMVRLKFKGKLFPVNPFADEINGIKAYPSLKDIPVKIDLVVVATPAKQCPNIIKDCIEIGIKQLVIVTGGFSEGGAEGEKLHNEIKDLIQSGDIRTIGPNTLSPINTENNLIISFHDVLHLKKGGLSMVFQSGLYEYKMDWIFSYMGINKIIDLGNKIDLTEVEALEYLSLDKSTKTIAMHIESIKGNGKKFKDNLMNTTIKKPVIILKSGRTSAGSKAAASHTGSIASENDLIFDSLIKQSGGIRANDLEEFFDFAKAFEFLEPPKGNRLAIITLSGGEGVIATDSCETHGFQMAKISQESSRKLKEIFPPWEVPINPFDSGVCMEFHAENFESALNLLSTIPEDEGVDCLVMQLPSTVLLRASFILKLSAAELIPVMDILINIFKNLQKAGKPIAFWKSSMEELETFFVNRLELQSIPVFPTPNRAIKALASLYQYNVRKEKRLKQG